jgi:GH15 family glucan-1,4-alpha-glucosidase
MPKHIGDYALIGNGHSAALVGSSGSIDWLCLPWFDSPACFAALLGDEKNGHWRIAPADHRARTSRRYVQDTMILETDFECPGGVVTVVDFMARGAALSSIVRIVQGRRGNVRLRMDLAIRFDYGRLVPWVTRQKDGTLTAVAGPHVLELRTPVQHRGEHLTTVAEFSVAAGQSLPFVLTYGRSYESRREKVDPHQALEQTRRYWGEWSARCANDGPWREAIVRSLLTLKALIYEPTGGMVAAATSSVPELAGGPRNWDYRFCWLRDSTLTLLSFLAAGYREEAEAWRQWLLRAIAGSAAQLQPIYTVIGENRLDEWQAEWLDGFNGAKPVRIGNAASTQLQLDVFGEILDVFHHARRNDPAKIGEGWDVQRELMAHLETILDVPDRGIWEVRDRDRHFTHSKVMAWVAFDRAVRAVERFSLPGPSDHWRRLRDGLHAEICARGYDAEVGAFVRAYGEKELDAATLMIPLVGFLPAADPRVVNTVRAIHDRLMTRGFVRRYDTESAGDGMPAGEGVFLPCTLWLADNLILQNRHDEARELFGRVLDARNDVGLLAEEYDAETGIQIGNFPQALSHLSLIGTALNLQDHHGPAHERSRTEPRPA